MGNEFARRTKDLRSVSDSRMMLTILCEANTPNQCNLCKHKVVCDMAKNVLPLATS